VSDACEVWVTGVGTATPLGHDYRAVADGLLEGRSCIRPVTSFDVSGHPSRIAGVVEDVPCPEGWDAAEVGRWHRLDRLALWCCVQALRDAGWWERRGEVRIGLVMGVGAEWLILWESGTAAGGQDVRETAADAESVVAATRRRLGLSGPAVTVAAACASGNVALAQARRWLELGWVDVCLAGACDMGVTPLSLAGFGNLRALSRRNDEPARASRPFDRGRDGFVMAEGGAMFVLEPAASARRRSARAYARVAGYGASSDAHNMVIPSPDPAPATAAVRQALADARLAPSHLGYVNAHATSTPVGDVTESRVLEAALGGAVRSVPVSSTKGTTGHLLTAAAAVEAIACLAALERQTVPPTINLDDPDPECGVCHVPNQAQERPVRAALSNSFGFGGSNTCLVLTSV
jgi:3-oxoacyl-[acyl-carrier-protein] synthase II